MSESEKARDEKAPGSAPGGQDSHSGPGVHRSRSRSYKHVSSKLGGGRISGSSRSSASSHRSARRDKASGAGSGGRHAGREKSGRRSGRKKSRLRKLLSFTGFSYNRMTRKDNWLKFRHFCIGAVPLLCLAFAAHSLSLGAGRLWLDHSLVGAGSFINSADGILHVWLSAVEGEYASLSWFIMWLERWLWGVDGNGYHLLNIGLHATSAILVWRLARNLELHLPAPWWAGAFFAVHPLCFPAVGWIYSRSVLLATCLGLGALLSFTTYDKPNADELDDMALLRATILACLSGLAHAGVGFAIPFVALVTMILRRGRKVDLSARHLLRCLPLFFAILPGLTVSAVVAYRSAPASQLAVGWPGQFKHFGWSFWVTIGRALWPDVPFLHSPGGAGRGPLIAYLPAAAVALAWIVLLVLRRRPLVRPVFLAFSALLVITLGMVCLIPNQGPWRYGVVGGYLAYAPSIPVVVFFATAIAALCSNYGEDGVLLANVSGILIVTALLSLTVSEATIFQSHERLWTEVSESCPDAVVGHKNLAVFLYGQNRMLDALPHLHSAIALDGNDAETLKLLGKTLLALGKAEEAEEYLYQAFARDPDLREDEIEAELQRQLEALGNNPDGLPEFLNISALPGHGKSAILEYDDVAFTADATPVGLQIRQAYEKIMAGDLQAAGALADAIINRDPGGAMGHYAAGYIAFEQGRFLEAVTHLRLAVETQPGLAGAHYFLGVSYCELQAYDKAADALMAALRLEPQMAPGYYQLGLAAQTAGNWDAALECYAAAIFVKHDHVPSLRACADILATHPNAELRDGRKALKLAQRAVHHAPEKNAPLLMTLAAAYAEAGFMDDAIGACEQAMQMADTPELKAGVAARMQAFKNNQPFRGSLPEIPK